MLKTKDEIILVDGSSYFYRAYHALPPLSNTKGMPTGAIHGVLNMLKKLIKDHNPKYLAMIFDAKGKTFRDDLYAEYKANRGPMPDDLQLQVKPLHAIIAHLGVPVIVMQGVEADDVIGSLTHTMTKQGYRVLISTGDKDMTQLVNSKVRLINTMNNQVLDTKGVLDKFGVNPEQIIDYLTLVGDKVDNVPGVDSCGPKTAVKWLQQYHNIDNLIEHADEIKGKIGLKLKEAIPQLGLSKQLVTIKTDVAVSDAVAHLQLGKPDSEQLIPLFEELEMNSWLQDMQQDSKLKNPSQHKFTIVYTKEDLDELITSLEKYSAFVIDVETTSLDCMQAELVGIAFAFKELHGYYLPLQHDEDTQTVSINQAISKLKPLLAKTNLTVIGHNLKYDMNVLHKYDLSIQANIFDTMVASYVLNTTNSRHDLDTLALKWLNHTTITFSDVAGTGKTQKTFNQIPIDEAGKYAAEDASVTFALYQCFSNQMQSNSWSNDVCQDLDFPLVKVLSSIETNGVQIDDKMLSEQSANLGLQITELVVKAHALVGYEFNLSSPKQLQKILYDELQIPVIKKTPKGQPSTAEGVLAELALSYELPQIILTYRQLSKLKSTYTDALPLQINSTSKRIHTSFNQTITTTGRLSSTEPNLQNIPIRTKEGRKIRQAFVAPKGYKILSADYSQIELRVMAHLSQDDTLLKAFNQDLDVHSFTASDVFSVPIAEVTSEQRRKAKAINFGLIYGMSEFGLSKQLGITIAAAKQYIAIYFERYPKVKQYINTVKENAHTNGYVESIFGRRLYLPEINSNNYQRRQAAERTAINAPVQGSAADIIKFAMLKIDAALKKQILDARMTMQVHDELVFEVLQDHTDDLCTIVTTEMQHAAALSVKLEVDVNIADCWDK